MKRKQREHRRRKDINMLYEIREQFSIDMISDEGGPHISLYQPTHRHFPENKQDSIVFKNLLGEIKKSLDDNNEQGYHESLMKPLYELEKDSDFWNYTLDGIAVLANQNKCIIYKLTGDIKAFTIVNERFHIKPLIEAFQLMEKYQLLVLSQNDFSIYEGDRNGISEIEIDADIPRTLEAVLGKQLTDASVTQGSFGGVGRHGVFHGLGDNKVEEDKDVEKYFRYVDQYVNDNYSKISKLPLILVSLKEYHAQFKDLSNNIYFIETCIEFSYDLVGTQELEKVVLEVIKSLNQKKEEKTIAAYKKSEAELLGSSDLTEVVKAAYESRIETLLIEENKIVSGKVDPDTGKLILGEPDNLNFGDVLDSLAELVLKKRGEVLIIPKDKMPSVTGVAGIYRYK